MDIKLPTDTPAILTVDDEADEREIAEALSMLPAIMKIADKVGEESHFAAYWHHGNDSIDASTINDIANAYLDKKPDEFEAIDEWAERFASDPTETYEEDTKGDLKKSLSEVVDAIIEERHDLDEDDLLEELAEVMKDRVVDAMCDNDTSRFRDAIPTWAKADIVFIPGTNDLSFEDLMTSHRDVCSDPGTIRPDANFMRALAFFNVSPREFVEAAKNYGHNLIDPDVSELSGYRQEEAREYALKWKAILDLDTDNHDNISKLPLRDKYEIADWNAIVDIVRTGKNHDHPPAMTMDSLFTVLGEASYGGNPAFVARVPLVDIIDGKLEKPMLVTKGGFVGIHNFANGSGYIEMLDNEIVLDPAKGSYRSKFGRYTVDEVYGIVGSYYDIESTSIERDAYTRVKDDKWLRIDGDKTVSITSVKGDDGITTFNLHTVGTSDLEPAGPVADGEVFLSLEEAKEEGNWAVEQDWVKAPTL